MSIKTFRRRTTIGSLIGGRKIFLTVILVIILSSFRVATICRGEVEGRLTIFATGGNKTLLMFRDQASTTRRVDVDQNNNASLIDSNNRIESMKLNEPSNDSDYSGSSLEPVYLSDGANGVYPIDQNNQENTFYNDYNQPNEYTPNNNYDNNNFNNNPDGSIYAVIGPHGIVHKDEFGALGPATSYGAHHHHHHHKQRQRIAPTHQQNYNGGSMVKDQLPDHLMTSDINKQFHAHSNHQTRKSPEGLGSILDSGQVLLSKEISSTGQPKAAVVEAISVNDLKTILKRLRPLDVQQEETYDDNNDDDDDDSEEQEQGQDRGQNETENKQIENKDRPKNLEPVHRLQRTVPNSAFYEGSGKDGHQESSRDPGQRPQPSSSGSDEDLKFLRNLVNIGEDRSPKSPVVYDDLIGPPDRPNHQLVYVPGDRQALATKVEENEPSKLDQSIPIDKLVDHLMSNSRMATFGIQHNDVNSPNGEENNNNNDDGNNGEEEDEEDDDGNLGGGDDDDDDDPESQEADESALRATRIRMNGDRVGNYSPIINDTTDWVPMDSLGTLTRGDQRINDTIERNGNTKKRKRRKKRKKKKRKKKGEPSVFGLVVGNRMLNRTEVFKLIRILNKMSNKSKSSKEREASRKLLKFLIKLVLEEYKKEREKHVKPASERDSGVEKDPVRELLRSVLEGPVDMKNSTANDSSIELRPLPIAKIRKLESTSQKAGPKDVASKQIDQVDESNQDESSEKDKEKNLHPTRGLGELADDLEHYFDADFFEDLADNRANVTQPPDGGDEDEKRPEETIRVAAPKRRRASRGGGYRLPVPIYGQLETDKDGDDIDPDLDGERMARKSEPTRRRYARKRRPPVGFRGRRKRYRRRRRPVGRRRFRQTRPRVKEDPDEAEDPDEEPSGNYQPASGEDRAQEDSGPLPDDGHEPEPSNRVVDEESSRRPGKSQEVTGRPEDGGNQDYDDEEDDGKEVDQAPEERRLSDESVSSDIRVRVPEGTRRPRFDPEPDNGRTRTNKKRRKSSKRMMAESRHEIPAPIVAGHLPAVIYNPSMRSHGRKPANTTTTTSNSNPKGVDVVDPVHPNGGDSLRLHNKKTGVGVDHPSNGKLLTNKRVLPKSKIKKLPKPSATGRDLTVAGGDGVDKKKRRDRSTKGMPTKRKEKKKVAPPIDLGDRAVKKNRVGPPGGGESDSDYYNESSSYSELCGDDGKCKVKRTQRGSEVPAPGDGNIKKKV